MVIKIQSPKTYRFLDYVNKHVSSDTQRLVAGVTAIISQPLIDLHNKRVDEETRWTSVMRTIAKIVVGTTVGVAIRHYSIKAVKKNPIFWRQIGDNKEVLNFPGKNFWDKIDFSNEKHRNINSYANTVGTIIGTATGLFTNFIIDAPLTKIFTNYLNKNIKPICMNNFKNKSKSNEVQNE